METSQIMLSFANISGKKIEADFDGGATTSDGGALLLRQAEARTGIVDRIVGAISDRRHQSYIDHTYTDLVRQRVFQIACGYEDANDSNDLRSDPGLKTACERLPLTGDDLASQPTMSRLENSVTRSDLYRMAEALLETFIESYDRPPKKLIMDIDDTDDPTHGSQQLTLFHAYYDEYCYLPVHLYEAESGKLITTVLRPGRRIRGREAAAILKRVLDHLILVWPKTKITLRGDSHFSTPEVHDLCDGYGIDFILGQAINLIRENMTLPVVSLVTDPNNLWHSQYGIYTDGTNALRRRPGDNDAPNYSQDWERPFNIEFYDATGNCHFNLMVGGKIRGGLGTRVFEQKSLSIFARRRYGTESIKCRLFPGKDISEVRRFILRNSGDDHRHTQFHDPMVHTLIAGKMDIDYQAYQPVVVFLNAEYLGVMNLREKTDDYYPETNFSIAHGDVELVDGEQDSEHYQHMLDFISMYNNRVRR